MIMARQWSAFSAQDHEIAGKRLMPSVRSVLAISSFVCLIMLQASSGAWGDATIASPTPSSGGGLDQSFLLLPAYDLQWVKPPQGIKVGDPLVARIQEGVDGGQQLPKDLKIQIPQGTFSADSSGGSSGDRSPEPDEPSFLLSETVTDHQFTITPVKPGHVSVPSLVLVDDAGKQIARTNPLSVEVTSAISPSDPKPKEAEPPRPPVSLGIPLATLVLATVALLALLGVGIYALIRWLKKRKGVPVKPIEPPKPEDEVALVALVKLEKRGLIQLGHFKTHYFAISEILKHYIGDRHGFDAAESTTFEMVTYLQSHKGLPDSTMETLIRMFEKLDLVKFTDHIPDSREGAELVEEARKFVMITRRPPPVVTADGASSASR
jgi:hypothetical protein